MLFRKNQQKICGLCAHCTPFEEGTVLCVKRGVKPETAHCRRFRYDPCKRKPSKPKALDFSRYDDTDFSL